MVDLTYNVKYNILTFIDNLFLFCLCNKQINANIWQAIPPASYLHNHIYGRVSKNTNADRNKCNAKIKANYIKAKVSYNDPVINNEVPAGSASFTNYYFLSYIYTYDLHLICLASFTVT